MLLNLFVNDLESGVINHIWREHQNIQDDEKPKYNTLQTGSLCGRQCGKSSSL